MQRSATVPAQKQAIETYAVRAFVVTNANLTGADQARRLVDNLGRITRFADGEPSDSTLG